MEVLLGTIPPSRRNCVGVCSMRLLNAWVDHLLVVETGERSGALITAGYAH